MKQLLFAMLAVYGLIGYQGCKKDVPDVVDQFVKVIPPGILNPLTFPKQDGMLVFADENHFEQGLAQLIQRTPNELLAFGDSLGLLTQGNILRMVEQDEDSNERQFYAGLPDTLTPAQYDSLRPGYQPGSTFQMYAQSGIVEIIIDPTGGGRSIQLTMKERSMKEVLNAQGEVRIGDRKYVYTDTTLRIFDLSGNLLETTSIGKRDATHTNYNRHWHLSGVSLPSYVDSWIQDPCLGARYRHTGIVKYTCKNFGTVLYPQFYYHVRAEKLVLGRWQKDTGYRPLLGLNASWKYRHQTVLAGQVTTYDYPPNGLPSLFPQTPRYYSIPGSNDMFERLNPSGRYTINGAGSFNDNAELYQINFLFTFNGCGSTYNYILN